MHQVGDAVVSDDVVSRGHAGEDPLAAAAETREQVRFHEPGDDAHGCAHVLRR